MLGEEYDIRQGHHPMLLTASKRSDPFSFQSSQDDHFIVVTGANMSGKTTYIKGIAILQILAQIGAPLPAERAKVRLVSRICTRLGSDDDLESNASTFTVELREACYILSSLDADSLVLIDELGRGTSTICGLALTTAICERLARSRATVLFVTHFAKLVSYLNTFPTAKQVTLSASSECAHNAAEGPQRLAHSGVELLRKLSFPSSVSERAAAMLKIVHPISHRLNQAVG